MTVWTALYTLLIGPLELLFETIFALVNRHISNPGLAIIFLSLCVNLLVLPLYRRADRLQAEERDLEDKLKPGTDHIKAVFKGDERFMMMQTFYRQNHYKPVYALRGTLSLLLEIPFFIAAYHFLSNLKLLNGASFGPIRDLAVPDGLLTISGFPVNVLPVLMTLINILSAAIYMQGFSFKNKLQMYGMALIFLILLYDSPSGLVFYWTLNNLFSLCKNIFYKLQNPDKVLRWGGIAGCILGLAGIDWLLFRHSEINVRTAGYLAGAAFCLLVLLVLLVKLRKPGPQSIPPADQMDSRIFWSSGVFMILLTGVLIPSAVLKSSPEEFTTVVNYHSPLWNLLSCFLLAAGTFGVWFGIFYKIAAPAGKTLMSRGFFCLAVISVIDYLFFGTHRGTLSPTLVILKPPSDTVRDVLINLLILLEAVLLFYFLLRKYRALMIILMSSLCLAAGIMSGINTFGTARILAGIEKNIALRASIHPEIHLSKNGKNVVILMMDRSIGYYMSYLMAERPELRQKFDGFTYYPNTISFGSATNSALPAVYGGYEYTTEKLNERSDTPLRIKHNEALLLMPTLFSQEGYRITLIDPSYANYSPDSDLSIYDDLPNTTAYATKGLFVPPEYTEAIFNVRNRNFFCYSLYKTVPLLLQPMIYTGGLYNNPDDLAGFNAEKMGMQRTTGALTAYGIDLSYQYDSMLLSSLPDMTVIEDTDTNTYFTMDNTATHSPTMLQMPDYEQTAYVDNTPFDSVPVMRTSLDGRNLELGTTNQLTHYHVNIGSAIIIGKWLDFLRENDVYDNTRIIIVGDHGRDQGYENLMFGPDLQDDILFYNPLLMFKDFGSTGFTVDDRFMTNAEVPSLAMGGLIGSPVNPFTGNPVANEDRDLPVHHIYYCFSADIAWHNGNTYRPGSWFALHGFDVFNRDAWEKLGEY